MNSSSDGTRLASVSDTPYIPMPNRIAARDEPQDAARGHVELGAPQDRRRDQHDDLQRGDGQRDDKVRDHDQGTGDRRGEEIAPRAALAVEDHADAREHAVQRYEEGNGADGGEAHVVEPGNARADRRERGRDHEREQHRGQQRRDELAGRPHAECEAAPGERAERRDVARPGPHRGGAFALGRGS